jgi:hypothetical protein
MGSSKTRVHAHMNTRCHAWAHEKFVYSCYLNGKEKLIWNQIHGGGTHHISYVMHTSWRRRQRSRCSDSLWAGRFWVRNPVRTRGFLPSIR